MSNRKKNLNKVLLEKPWYKQPAIIIPAIITIIAALIGAPFLFPPSPVEDFSVSVNPMQAEIHRGNTVQTIVTVNEDKKYAYDTTLSVNEQPSGILATFDCPIGKPSTAFSSKLTITTSNNAPIADDIITIKATGADGKEHVCKFTLSVKAESISPSIGDALSVSQLFYASGWMGDWGDIKLDVASTDNPHSSPLCLKVTYLGMGSQGNDWAGIYWQYPTNNWGDKTGGRDLTGATMLTFWARGANGGEKGEFKVGGITGMYPDSIQPVVAIGIITLSSEWQQYTIDLTGKDLSHVVGGFCWVTNKDQNPNGCTFYLDDIKYETALRSYGAAT
jgi:hypothetical protein